MNVSVHECESGEVEGGGADGGRDLNLFLYYRKTSFWHVPSRQKKSEPRLLKALCYRKYPPVQVWSLENGHCAAWASGLRQVGVLPGLIQATRSPDVRVGVGCVKSDHDDFSREIRPRPLKS